MSRGLTILEKRFNSVAVSYLFKGKHIRLSFEKDKMKKSGFKEGDLLKVNFRKHKIVIEKLDLV